MMQAGDVLFRFALCRDGMAMVIITPVDSTIQNQLVWLFGLEDRPEFEFTVQEIAGTSNPDLAFATRYILDELGIEPEEPEADRLDELIEQFGMVFPTTKIFSEIARAAVTDVDPADDPDGALLDWLDMEEQLFRRLERRIVAERIASGFIAPEGADVDGFLSFSLSVQNRRKSQCGGSHWSIIWRQYLSPTAYGIRAERRPRTATNRTSCFRDKSIITILPFQRQSSLCWAQNQL